MSIKDQNEGWYNQNEYAEKREEYYLQTTDMVWLATKVDVAVQWYLVWSETVNCTM